MRARPALLKSQQHLRQNNLRLSASRVVALGYPIAYLGAMLLGMAAVVAAGQAGSLDPVSPLPLAATVWAVCALALGPLRLSQGPGQRLSAILIVIGSLVVVGATVFLAVWYLLSRAFSGNLPAWTVTAVVVSSPASVLAVGVWAFSSRGGHRFAPRPFLIAVWSLSGLASVGGFAILTAAIGYWDPENLFVLVLFPVAPALAAATVLECQVVERVNRLTTGGLSRSAE